jgi:hypothetical protein
MSQMIRRGRRDEWTGAAGLLSRAVEIGVREEREGLEAERRKNSAGAVLLDLSGDITAAGKRCVSAPTEG